jgi:ferrous iron transport protein B
LKNTLLKGRDHAFCDGASALSPPYGEGCAPQRLGAAEDLHHRAGKVIVPVVVILSFLNSMGTDGTFGNEDSDRRP